MKPKLIFVNCLALAALLWSGPGYPSPAAPVSVLPYQNPAAPPVFRVEDLLQRMTEAEKLSVLTLDAPDPLRLNTQPVPRLGVPSLRTTDAPEGIRDGQASAFPMGIVMASTWDPALIGQVGMAVGQEAKAKNRQVVYGPDLNLQRSPQGGRGFEEFSEDPYLTAQMAVNYINGMQSQGVAACPKHFVCNDQEFHRQGGNMVVDERTLHEIYLPPFQAALQQGHAWAVMPGLNQVNGSYMAQNQLLLGDLLQKQWRWDGLVISDWGAIHDTAAAANAGTDIEMPQAQFFASTALAAALQQKQITQDGVDDKVRRLLRLMLRTGRLDGPQPADASTVNSPAHQQLALRVAQEGIILLKNDRNLLPLEAKRVKSIAVIGPNAQDTQLGGRWSAEVHPFYSVSILDGLRKAAGPGVTIEYAQGCPRTGASSPASLTAATALAAKSDVAVVVVGMDNNYEGEELDPPNIGLPGDQDALIQAIAAANKNTIVVLNQGTPVLMNKWLSGVPALVESWYAGQEQGHAVAQILFGQINPSGKMTETIAARREDYSDFGSYPGANGVINYSEGLYVGYRHFDKAKIAPLFPFGFGLSYTTFAYSALKAPTAINTGQKVNLRLTAANTGPRAGDEIVQLYVRPLDPKVDRPVQELKGFQRVSLLPGKKAMVTFTLDDAAFSRWDTNRHQWHVDPGLYEIEVGASSRDIRLRSVIKVSAAMGGPK